VWLVGNALRVVLGQVRERALEVIEQGHVRRSHLNLYSAYLAPRSRAKLRGAAGPLAARRSVSGRVKGHVLVRSQFFDVFFPIDAVIRVGLSLLGLRFTNAFFRWLTSGHVLPLHSFKLLDHSPKGF